MYKKHVSLIILLFSLNVQSSFFKKLFSYFSKKNYLSEKYSYNDLPHELILKIIKGCDQKTWATLRCCSRNFYALCLDKSSKYSVQNCLKAELRKYFVIYGETYLDKKSFITMLGTTFGPKTFCTLYHILKSYLNENKKWINNQKLDKICYYFVLYCVRDYILHNTQLDYIKINKEDCWKRGEKPATLSYLQQCIKLLKTYFTFPMNFKIDNQQYFLDLPNTEEVSEVYNPWCIKMIYGKNGKRNCEVMYYDYYGSELSGQKKYFENYKRFMPECLHIPNWQQAIRYHNEHLPKILKSYDDQWNKENYNVKSLSLIINMKREDNSQYIYAFARCNKIFKIIPRENLQHLAIIFDSVQDNFIKDNSRSPFYFDAETYVNLKQLSLKNTRRTSQSNKLFTINQPEMFKKMQDVFSNDHDLIK